MKRGIQNLLNALLTMALPMVARGQFSYITNNGTITITGCSDPNNSIVIPATINGFPVTRIQSMSGGCDPASVVVPNTVLSIGNGAFYLSVHLTNIFMGNSVTNIGNEAFYACSSLANVVIPDSVISIGDAAFNFSGLNSIFIGKSVTNIGFGVFLQCFWLTNFTVSPSNVVYSSLNGVLFNKTHSSLVLFPSGLGGTYHIPEGVTSIEQAAFNRVTKNWGFDYLFGFLTNVIFPGSVTNIANGAFSECTLNTAYFLGNVPVDDAGIFAGTYQATVFYMPGTTGWGSTFGGIPAVLWNPQAQAVRLSMGHLEFTIAGPPNAGVVVEAASNLVQSAWVPVATNTLSESGAASFMDTQSNNFPSRYYRFGIP